MREQYYHRDVFSKWIELAYDKVVAYFEKRTNIKVRRQERLKVAEEQDFRQGKLLGRYIAKILYEWGNRKFEREYLRKLKRN